MGISTHILDTASGTPAVSVSVVLSRLQGEEWLLLNGGNTDADGRIKHLLPAAHAVEPGHYRARFDTAAYYKAQGLEGLYPYVDVVFKVRPGELHYHIPLLLTANSYSTYRGS